MNFPSSPTVDQLYTFEDKTWKWTGVAWKAVPSIYVPVTLDTLDISFHDQLQVDATGKVFVNTNGTLSHDGTKFIIKSEAGPISIQSGEAHLPTLYPHSSTPVFNCATSNVFEPAVMTSNLTAMTLINGSAGQTIKIIFKQDATGGRTVAPPAGASVTGSMPSGANAIGILTLIYYSRDSRWIGNWTSV